MGCSRWKYSRWDVLDESILNDGILNDGILNDDIIDEDIDDIQNEDILNEGILDKDRLRQRCAKCNVLCSLFKFIYWKSLMMIFISKWSLKRTTMIYKIIKKSLHGASWWYIKIAYPEVYVLLSCLLSLSPSEFLHRCN